jgi:hypothetical protein
MREKTNPNKQGYCFVNFEDPEIAKFILENFNGKPLPVQHLRK